MLTLSFADMKCHGPHYGQDEIVGYQYSVGCESLDADKSRYHIWVVATDAGKITMHHYGTVFKNPAKDAPRTRKTIKLSIERGQGKVVGQYLLEMAKDLLPGAIKARNEKVTVEAEAQRLARRMSAITASAQELLDMLKVVTDELVSVFNDGQATHVDPDPASDLPTVRGARALIARLS